LNYVLFACTDILVQVSPFQEKSTLPGWRWYRAADDLMQKRRISGRGDLSLAQFLVYEVCSGPSPTHNPPRGLVLALTRLSSTPQGTLSYACRQGKCGLQCCRPCLSAMLPVRASSAEAVGGRLPTICETHAPATLLDDLLH
jgi:hypothetical protein